MVSFQHEISTIVKRFSMVGALEVLEYALLTESLPPPPSPMIEKLTA